METREDSSPVRPKDSSSRLEGANELQNVPDIQRTTITPIGDVEVTYRVPSDPTSGGVGAKVYLLTSDFYKAHADGQEGKACLGTDTYSNTSSNDDYDGCGSAPCPGGPCERWPALRRQTSPFNWAREAQAESVPSQTR